MSQSRVMSLTIPCGKGGLNRMDNYLDFPIEDLAWMDGIMVENNAWEKEAGKTVFNSAGVGDAVMAILDFTSSVGTDQRLYALTDGDTLKALNNSGAEVASHASTGYNSGMFVEGRLTNGDRCVILFSEDGVPLFTTATTWAAISHPAPEWASQSEWPHFAFQHNFRMLCATKISSLLYMSNPADHTEFASTRPNTRIMDIYSGEQRYISGGISWRGRAYLWKRPLGVYFVDDSDVNLANWTTQKVTDAVGAAGPGCMVAYEDDVIFLSTDGYFYSLSDIQTLGQKSVTPILPSELGEFIRSEINIGRLDLVRSMYYQKKRQLWFALPAAGGTVCNRRLIFDANLPGKIRLTWSERDEMVSIGTRRRANVQEPMFGDSDGFIWIGDQAARLDDGEAYTSQFETPPIPLLPNAEQYANLKELQYTFKPQGEYDLTLEVHTDQRLRQTLTLSQQSTGSPTGSFTLDADVTAGTEIATKTARLEGEARRIKFIGRNTADSENFALQSLVPRFTPGRHGI